MLYENLNFRFLRALLRTLAVSIGLLFSSLFFVSPSYCQERPTFFINSEGGYTTYKSKLVDSNDTSVSVKYAFGVHAGRENNLGVLIKTETNTTSFALNESKIASSIQDSIVRYYWGPVYIGGIVNQMQTTVSTADNDSYIDALTLGYGVNAGMIFQVGKGNGIFLDVSSVSTNTVKEINQADLTVGPRTDIKIGGVIRITRKTFKGLIGYSQRTLSYSLDGTSYAEAISSTWLGISADFYF